MCYYLGLHLQDVTVQEEDLDQNREIVVSLRADLDHIVDLCQERDVIVGHVRKNYDDQVLTQEIRNVLDPGLMMILAINRKRNVRRGLRIKSNLVQNQLINVFRDPCQKMRIIGRNW